MTEKVKERRPTVAALLSLFVMGLGQLYNGQLRRAVVFYALDILAAVAVATISTLLLSFHGLMILYFVGLIFAGIRIFAVIDAIIGARRIGEGELQRYNRWYVYVSVFLVTMIIQIVFENPVASYSIPSGAMLPTLLVGDYVHADKNAYHDQAPERGDVAVFKLPTDNKTDYIKRIVGLPGDRIQVVKGILHINGQAVKRERVDDFIVRDVIGNTRRIPRFIETLPNGRSHAILEENGDLGPSDNTEVYTVPAGHYFAMGDNRDNSQDSRFIGFVPAGNLVSRAEILFFSIDGDVWKFWKWAQSVRLDRIGNRID